MSLLFQPGLFFVFVKLLKRIGPYAVTLCKSNLYAICFCNAGFKHPFLPHEFILNSGYTAGEGLIILT